MFDFIKSFIDGAYVLKTTIKRDATSRKIMEALADSAFYTGEVSSYNGYFIAKSTFLKPVNNKILISTTKDDCYVIHNDHRYIPLRYGLSLILLLFMLFALKPIWNGFYLLILIIPLFILGLARICRLILKSDAHLFLERYYNMKRNYLKNEKSPNLY